MPVSGTRPSVRPALVVVVSLIAGLFAGALHASAPAAAADVGVGWGEFTNHSDAVPFKGTFAEGDMRAVCAEKGKAYPTDPLIDLGYVGSERINALRTGQTGEAPSVSDDQVAGISRVLHEYVDTTDPNEAAALEYAIHRVLSPEHSYRSVSGRTHPTYDAVIAEDMLPSAGPANIPLIQSLADRMVETINTTTAGVDATGAGTLVFTTDDTHTGTVTMVGTDASAGTITLTNGVFAATGSATLEDATANTAYPILGAPPADEATYRISGTFTFTPNAPVGYLPLVRLMGASNPRQQTAVGMGPVTSNIPFSGEGSDAAPRSLVFHPVLSTQAPRFFEIGEPFTDTVRFATAPADDGTHNAWHQSDEAHIEITAHGTVYGPFAEVGADWPLATAPADAPVAARMSLTTGPLGPTVEYAVTSTERAEASGVYTIVWTTDAADYSDQARRFVPEGWVYTDAFGLAEETGIVPMRLSGMSQADAPVVPGGVPGDTVSLAGTGVWLQQDAQNIPVVLRWDAYHDARPVSEIVEVAASDIPAEATLLGSVTVTVTDAGDVRTPGAELGFTAPASGSIVWVPSIRDADQGDFAGLIDEWSEAYGVPSQIQQVLPPAMPAAPDAPELAATGGGAAWPLLAGAAGLLAAGAWALVSGRSATSRRRA